MLKHIMTRMIKFEIIMKKIIYYEDYSSCLFSLQWVFVVVGVLLSFGFFFCSCLGGN